MLLYAPACTQDGFLNAIGYLVRRLDENTGPDNFLRHTFRLQPDTDKFAALADSFRASLELAASINHQPHRRQDRQQPPIQPAVAKHWSELVGETDTDWSVPANSIWAKQIIEAWKNRADGDATMIPLTIGGQAIDTGQRQIRESIDPSRPGVVACRFATATIDQLRSAVLLARQDNSGWRTLSPRASTPMPAKNGAEPARTAT